MRPRRFGERQTFMDARMKLAGPKHVDESAHSSAAFVGQVVPRVDGELSYRGRVFAHLGSRQEIKRRLAPEGAVNDERSAAIVEDLRAARMNTAADLVERSVHETLTYYAFPDIHWQKIRTN
ncbi:MAG: hypothetical protein WBE71_26375, partial [Xanthobacteraceae bacterium]